MRDDDDTWQIVPEYSVRWVIERPSGSGGQGHGHVVRRVGETSSDRFFLKVLKDQTNPQRRARMFREAVTLETYDHPRIPRLIESNAQLHADRQVSLYLVTDLIPGSVLGAFHKKPFSFVDAVSITEQLAETVAYL